MPTVSNYIGRFAPSPSGLLHAGSVFTAVASYLHARQATGEWLVRIEDIDPPREVPGAASDILRTLETLELQWDRSVLYQSTRIDAYVEIAERLLKEGRAFRCSCSRSELRSRWEAHRDDAGHTQVNAGCCSGSCRIRTHHTGATSIRMDVNDADRHACAEIVDGLQGPIDKNALNAIDDYVIWRRDDLPAYHLAVVLDDAWQQITTIVRGRDLLDVNPIHRHLQRALDLPVPAYFHLPIVTNAAGEKLSKQTGAEPVDIQRASTVAANALRDLGLNVPTDLHGSRPSVLWNWAIPRWRIEILKNVRAKKFLDT